MDKKKKELNFLLMYINSWQEESRKESEGKIFRVWKGYPFEIMNELEKENLIRQYDKSMVITKEGQAKAQELMRQYLRV